VCVYRVSSHICESFELFLKFIFTCYRMFLYVIIAANTDNDGIFFISFILIHYNGLFCIQVWFICSKPKMPETLLLRSTLISSNAIESNAHGSQLIFVVNWLQCVFVATDNKMCKKRTDFVTHIFTEAVSHMECATYWKYI